MTPESPQQYYQRMQNLWAEQYHSCATKAEMEDFYNMLGFEGGFQPLLNDFIAEQHDLLTPKPMLDFGCDNGISLEYFHALNIDKYGTDINENAILKAQKQFPDFHFSYTTSLPLPFAEKQFGFIFASGVLKHLRHEDRELYYQEFSRISDYLLVSELNSEEEMVETMEDFSFYHSNFAQDLAQRFTLIKQCDIATTDWGNHILALYKI